MRRLHESIWTVECFHFWLLRTANDFHKILKYGATISLEIFIFLIEFCFVLSGRWEVGLWDWGLCNLWCDEVVIAIISVIMLFIFLISLILGSYVYTTKVSLNGKKFNCCLSSFSLLKLWVVRWRSALVGYAYIGTVLRF